MPYVLVGVFTWSKEKNIMISVQTNMQNHIKIVCYTHRNEDQICLFNGRVDIGGEKEVLPTARQHHFIQTRLQQQEEETHFMNNSH